MDHTPDGGEVRIRGRRSAALVVVAVSDTGSGLDPAAACGLRQRFHSGGQRAGRADCGLGLALTHDVADRHGGQLRLVPAGRGTMIELVLPADDS